MFPEHALDGDGLIERDITSAGLGLGAAQSIDRTGTCRDRRSRPAGPHDTRQDHDEKRAHRSIPPPRLAGNSAGDQRCAEEGRRALTMLSGYAARWHSFEVRAADQQLM